MTNNDLLNALGAAAAAAALTMTAFWPGTLDAGDPQPIPAKIAQPKLVSHGVELTLASAVGSAFTAGEEPTFELAALNTNSTPAEIELHIAMSATAPADAMSRVVRTPAVLWQTDQALTLGPGENKKVMLTCGTKLPPMSVISVLLQEKRSGDRANLEIGSVRSTNSIVALSFSTFPGKQQPEQPQS